MTSTDTNLEQPPEAGKSDWPVVGARVHPEVRRMLDVAAGYLGQNRSELIVDASVTKAREILEAHGVPLDQFKIAA